jgi:hypothetical protein
MTTSARKRSKVIGFLGTLVLSSTIMLWMLWHFPLGTAIATVVVLSALAVSARLARWIDTTDLTDLDRRKQGA